jgi:hypothetical protein
MADGAGKVAARTGRVTSDTAAVQTAAARNNATWCAAVCRSHGIPGTFGERVWRSARRPPPYYPDAVTLRPDATAGDLPHDRDTASVKDSFAALDLTPDGFVELFTARWIHRPAGLPASATPALRAEPVATAGHLRDWQAAWHGSEPSPDVFRPALLADPAVHVLAVYHGDDMRGGAVLNRSAGLVGVSNLFTADGGDIAAVWSATVATAASQFPGHPLVGYGRGEALGPALASGFVTLGTLRVWLRTD